MAAFQTHFLVGLFDLDDAPIGLCDGTLACHDLPNSANDLLELFVDLVLPNADDAPAESLQLQGLPAVALDVSAQLLSPEGDSGSGANVVFRAAVPEASVDEKRYTPSRKDNVRFPGRRLRMDAVAQSGRPEGRAQALLGVSILPANSGHLLGTGERTAPCQFPSLLLVPGRSPGKSNDSRAPAVAVQLVGQLGEELLSETITNLKI